MRNCYVYFVKNNTTGLKYVGCKYAKNAEPRLFWKTYFTSSSLVQCLIKEFGKEDFKFRILKTFGDDINAALIYEKTLLDVAVKRGDYVNLSSLCRASENIEEHLEQQSKLASVIGKITYHAKIGMFAASHEERLKICSNGGYAAADANRLLGRAIFDPDVRERQHKTLREKKVSAYYDPKLRKELSSKGGKKGAFSKEYYIKNNLSEEQRIEDQRQRGKRGGPGNKGFRWYHDENANYKYTPKQIKEVSFEQFMKSNPQYKSGTLPSENKGTIVVNDGIRNYHVDPINYDKEKYTKGKIKRVN